MIDVFGLGQCSLDYVGVFDAYPLPDTKHEYREMVIEGGGPVATALVALSRWGLRCYFSGVIGDDAFGRSIHSSLVQEGVDAGGLLVRKGESSQFAFIVAEPSTNRRTVFWRRSTGRPPGPREIDTGRLTRSKTLQTDGLFIEAALHAATIARREGVRVVVDAGTLRDGMLELAALADAFVASEGFARALVGDDNPAEACLKLAALGPSIAGVTLGPRGYVALCEGAIIREPAHPVTVLDTTGCGDVFHAGVTYGLLKGWDSKKTLSLANWAAAAVSTRLGGRAGIPPLAELRERGLA
ncbi:MAG TPA: PfkB family carbohydrate kinase [Syntrophales bacterium]|nr:PfkB family carbohydrate kinase [Syntrophales bacterium]HOX94285.1 PfkB family carbohydrate kinase [Syntrophales bacterium]HPI56219.1 PfkB family carbohydrate kinase [Syntrophales bacterium]HPN24407.1 PfkB family carbohydrate kinase [Syntrophales bacterium]HQM29037.1 PfkB family carbohydrate kinase [Syntrophales bacterium]